MDTSSIPLKQCSRKEHCVNPLGSWLPATAEFFNTQNVAKDHLYPQCKMCRRQYLKQYRDTHSDKLVAYRKQHYIVNRERVLKHQRDRYHERGEALRTYKRMFRTINGDRYREYERQSRKRHPETIRVNTQRKRARRRALPATLTASEWLYALEYFNNCCAACGHQLNDLFKSRKAHADHWIPLSSLECPGTVATNIVPLCGGLNGCNQSKSAKDPYKWLTERFSARQSRDILNRVNAYFLHVRACSLDG